jgi:hypothetical protein
MASLKTEINNKEIINKLTDENDDDFDLDKLISETGNRTETVESVVNLLRERGMPRQCGRLDLSAHTRDRA